jgi:hypothetical protein
MLLLDNPGICPLCDGYCHTDSIYEFLCRNCGLYVISSVLGKWYWFRGEKYYDDEFQRYMKMKAFW